MLMKILVSYVCVIESGLITAGHSGFVRTRVGFLPVLSPDTQWQPHPDPPCLVLVAERGMFLLGMGFFPCSVAIASVSGTRRRK